ncbi:MAG: DNA polymerase III subunit alpha [Oligoflexia bacterium]|nr:DNA polymerase III subunit alpha [Oligoflexia bacterium]
MFAFGLYTGQGNQGGSWTLAVYRFILWNMSYLNTHSKSFVHLHLHTQYSLLDGAIRINDLVKEAATCGMPAVAQSDHGNMFGAIDFYKAANKAGVKPIVGAEIYFTNGSRLDRGRGTVITTASASNGAAAANTVNTANTAGANLNDDPVESLKFQDEQEGKHRIFHLLLLAKNLEGYHNLIKIVSAAYTEGFYYRPRADIELLKLYNSGLIALSACLKGEVGYFFYTGQDERAIKAINKLHEIFKDDFYLEIQENGLEEQRVANKKIVAHAQSLSIPLVATNDCHYLKREDAFAQEVLLCIQTGKSLDDEKRMRLSTTEFYFKSAEEMRTAFAHLPEACDNTLRIADQCNLKLSFKDQRGNPIYHFPEFAVETEESLPDYFRRSAHEGLEQRFNGPHFRELRAASNWESDIRPSYLDRLHSEIEMIERMGFVGYYLIVSDFINWAKGQNIPVGPGRGSGVGSLVAYALNITNVDPIPYNLLFERFVNPERISMPDFDVDFCQDRRDEVIRYVTQKYGQNHVGQIITFGKLLARVAIRDVARVLSLPYSDADALAKLVPDELKITLDDALLKEPRLNEWASNDPKVRQVLNISRRLEGLLRHASIHAAGVVITSKPLVEYAPLFRGKEGEQVVGYDKDFCEEIGLVKFDFLGLKTLTLIDNASKFVRQHHCPNFDIEQIDLRDKKVFEFISSGQTLGIFQIESSGMRDLCMRIVPDSIDDLAAINALYRPGPLGSGMVDDFIDCKHGRKEIAYPFAELEPILKDTYGIILYQEQVMNIARVLAGYTLGQADILRKAMGKKKMDVMQEHRQLFIERAKERGHAADSAAELFDLMAKFAEYGFNKSHAVAYVYIAYQTAFLKYYYPTCFYAALLSTELDNIDKITAYIADAKLMGINTLFPDVNESLWHFNVVGTNIRYGMGAIKNVGAAAVHEIIAERDGTKEGAQEKKQEGGVCRCPYKSFIDFCERVNLRVVNKRVLESLIKVGAFDSVEKSNRRTLCENLESILAYAASVQAERANGQMSLFSLLGGSNAGSAFSAHPLLDIVESPDFLQQEKLQYEMELMGVYLSGHPLEHCQGIVSHLGVTRIADLSAMLQSETQTPKEIKDTKEKKETKEVFLLGILGSFKELTTKDGRKMARAALEDLSGKVESVIFPNEFTQNEALLRAASVTPCPLLVRAEVTFTEGHAKIFPKRFFRLEERLNELVNAIRLHLDLDKLQGVREADLALLEQLKQILSNPGERGNILFYLTLENTQMMAAISFPKEYAVKFSIELVGKVFNLFRLVLGKSGIKIFINQPLFPTENFSQRNFKNANFRKNNEGKGAERY